ncbi:MAG TPA: Clp protease N-terminal domain-containing protein [Vicinamibacterales bacterium]|nr:Clp protease N-terminal domain-containing protein [Vicinamibacterales bacterium]
MFERYDEAARRTLFYARYAASELRARSIDGEHLLLGLIREPQGRAARVLAAIRLLDLRKELEGARSEDAPPVPVSVEIPFSPDVKRMLEYAAEEADRLAHPHIGTEHLLLGLMRQEGSVAAAALGRYGLRLHTLREQVRALASEQPSSDEPDPEVRALIEQLTDGATRLHQLLSANEERAMRIDLLLMDLQALKKSISKRR